MAEFDSPKPTLGEYSYSSAADFVAAPTMSTPASARVLGDRTDFGRELGELRLEFNLFNTPSRDHQRVGTFLIMLGLTITALTLRTDLTPTKMKAY